MLRDKLTCLIFSCDKFSDLWNGNIKLFKENWPDRNFETYIVTDRETNKIIPGVGIIAAGPDLEWSDRLAFALKYVKTEYVFLTLDDYFLIEPVKSQTIEQYVDLMKMGDYSYFRLYPHPKRATGARVASYKRLYDIDVRYDYSVNLYPCLWKKEFLAFTVKDSLNAWMFEVSLHKQAEKYGAKCLVSYNNDYTILDVVRKGKILHTANSFFKKHPGIYDGNRELQSWKYEAKLWIKTMISRYSPVFLIKPLRYIYVQLGGKSFVYDGDTK